MSSKADTGGQAVDGAVGYGEKRIAEQAAEVAVEV
jgi:hypothetical protein